MKKKWWHEKIAYQIYPKSFKDSNGDGIGDIRGIIEKLDYLQELGIDLLWLSPIYSSPLADQGYDISDYYNIDPRFGTLDDLQELIEEGKKRNIGIVMDLVVNHCSDEHEWFKKAIADPDGSYGKYFYIENYKKGDKLPCNWRSYFGGSCWDFLPGHDDKIYLHVFHKKQPDLNWENPLLRKEIYHMINWWLDKGIAGFSQSKPWLMVNPKYKDINLAAQIGDPHSVFTFYKQLIALRKHTEYMNTFVYGDFVPYLEEQKNLLSFKRIGNKTILIAANYQKEPQMLQIDSTIKSILLSNRDEIVYDDNTIYLDGYDFVVAELKA